MALWLLGYPEVRHPAIVIDNVYCPSVDPIDYEHLDSYTIVSIQSTRVPAAPRCRGKSGLL